MEAVPKTKVALESSEDFSEPSIGFYTHQYADGREGVRYRLVTMAEDGLLIPYPELNRFFINRKLAQKYINAHVDLIDVTSYDEMVIQSMQEQSAYKREQTQKETFGYGVQKLVLEAESAQAEQPEAQKSYPAVYGHTLSYAMEHGEVDKYSDSRKFDR